MKRILLAVLITSCGGDLSNPSGPPAGHRLVTGRLVPPSQTELSRQPIALQLAALSIDGRMDPPIVSRVVSRSFSPAANGGQPVSFSLALPDDRPHVLLFQVPVARQDALGQLVARVRFAQDANGTLGDVLNGRAPGVTARLADLDLGTVKISVGRTSNPPDGTSPLADNVAVLGEGDSRNPLKINDTDGDGTPDLDDADDDNDLTPDMGDSDANGDGIEDAQQRFDVLLALDEDDNLIPDILEP